MILTIIYNIFLNVVQPINADIVEDTYDDLIRKKEYIKITKCVILSARNIDVDEINKKVVELLVLRPEDSTISSFHRRVIK